MTEDAGIVSGNASRCYQQQGENISRQLSVLEIDIVLAHLNSPVDTEQAHPSAVAVAMMTHIDFVGMLSIVDLVSLVSRPASSILSSATAHLNQPDHAAFKQRPIVASLRRRPSLPAGFG